MSNVIRFCNYFFNLCSAFDYGFFFLPNDMQILSPQNWSNFFFPKDAQMTKNKINSEKKNWKIIFSWVNVCKIFCYRLRVSASRPRTFWTVSWRRGETWNENFVRKKFKNRIYIELFLCRFQIIAHLLLVDK